MTKKEIKALNQYLIEQDKRTGFSRKLKASLDAQDALSKALFKKVKKDAK